MASCFNGELGYLSTLPSPLIPSLVSPSPQLTGIPAVDPQYGFIDTYVFVVLTWEVRAVLVL